MDAIDTAASVATAVRAVQNQNSSLTPPLQASINQNSAVVSEADAESADVEVKFSLPELERTAETLNRFVKSIQRNLDFQIHETTGDTVIQVKDKETNSIVRQIPAEEVVKLHEYLENITGILFKGEA